MASPKENDRLRIIALGEEPGASDGLAESVRDGLSMPDKILSCRFFYDEEGSNLFEEICELPEYYVTRAEDEILRDRASEIAGLFSGPTTVVELGSGSSTKTRTIIDAFLSRHGALRYVPLDISRTMLEASANALLEDFPGLEIIAIAAEYAHGLARIRKEENARKLILFLGSSIGNFDRREAGEFLADIRRSMRADDRLLLGIDLRKDPTTLERAYDDAAGTTARFNKNILVRINRELDANFDERAFEHKAVFREGEGRVEMHLVSREQQEVRIDALDMDVEFEKDESIHTENSYKYSGEEIETLARTAGLSIAEQWFDRERRFCLSLLTPACSS